jgi:hypothetical protein
LQIENLIEGTITSNQLSKGPRAEITLSGNGDFFTAGSDELTISDSEIYLISRNFRKWLADEKRRTHQFFAITLNLQSPDGGSETKKGNSRRLDRNDFDFKIFGKRRGLICDRNDS